MPQSQEARWKDESTIKQEEFRDGVDVERDRDRSADLEHVDAEYAQNRTTMWADDASDEPLRDCERYHSKRTRFEKLWAYNSGTDGHRCRRGKSPFKVDPNARDRSRLVEPLCDRLELGEGATERATDLARKPTPKMLNFIGGLSTWLVALALRAANEHGDVLRLDRNALDDIKEEFEIDDDQIRSGMNKI